MRRLLKILGVIAAILVITFLIFRTPDTDPAEMRAKYGGEPSQYVELEPGLTVHLRDEGPRDAPAIVLVHGLGADLHTWQPRVEDLREDYRVIRYDQIGHGLTGPAPDGQYEISSFAADLGLVVDSMGLEQFVLVGSSMGGRVAVSYALENQERLTGLVLIGASGAPVTETGSGNLAYSIVATPGIRNLVKYITPRSVIEKSMQQSVSNQDLVTPKQVDRYWELLRYPGNRAAALERLSIPRNQYSAEQMSGLDVPSLLMWGEEDALVPVSVGNWYAEHLPDAQLVLYPAIGHLPHEETAQASLADFRKWLVSGPLTTETGE